MDSASMHKKEERRPRIKVMASQQQSTNSSQPTSKSNKTGKKKKKKLSSRCRPVQIFQENEKIIRKRMSTNATVHRVATIESTLSQMNDTNSISSVHNNNGPIPGGGQGLRGALSNGSIFTQSNGRSMQCS